MMLYILQSHKNQLLRLHPAIKNQDFIICSFGCFLPIGGNQLSKLYNDAENTFYEKFKANETPFYFAQRVFYCIFEKQLHRIN